jgi:diguanylate cyclase (GGDEF)-like protein
MWHQLTAEGHWQGEISNRRKNGELYPSWLTISAVRNRDKFITHFVAVFADISSLKHAQAKLDYQAHHDPLTGLPNRTLFESRLLAALNAQQENGQGAVLFLDLDRFKHINDSLGHPVGDLLLKGIAVRLKEQVRDVDTVARLGGTNSSSCCPACTSQRRRQHRQQTAGCFGAPFQAGEHEFFTSASIGTSLYPQDGTDVATLIRTPTPRCTAPKPRAATASKLHPRPHRPGQRAHGTGHELRRAIERNELSCTTSRKSASTTIAWSAPKR